jgi:hypothetical protein
MTDIYVQPTRQGMRIGSASRGIEWESVKNFLRRLLP